MDLARLQLVSRQTLRVATIGICIACFVFVGSWVCSSKANAAPFAAESVSAGSDFTCAVSSGAAKCWGRNDFGQIGDGTVASSTIVGHAPVPRQVEGLESGVSVVSAGDDFACAVVSGSAKCWGKNDDGQLGDGTNSASSVPVQVSGLTSGVTSISAGYGHACAVVAGSAKCWGSQTSFFGALGNGVDANNDGNYDDSSVPVQVSGLTAGVTAISANLASSCAVASGAAKCWGSQHYGQLGNGVDSSGGGITSAPTPVQVSGLTNGVSLLTPGYEYTCALAVDAAKCWGHNGNGQLGDGWQSSVAATPIEPIGLGADVSDIDASTLQTCAVVDGAAKCWGKNYRGQLGDGTQSPHYEPESVNGLVSGVTDISTGWNHSCAIADGFVWCWGSDWYGEVGDGLGEYERDVTSPVQVVDTVPPPPPGPSITVHNPTQGQVVTSTELIVQVDVTGHPSTTKQCQLDEQDWVDCDGDWYLSGLAVGAHVVRIYAGDMFGGESMVEVYFSVVLTSTPPSGGGLPPAPSLPLMQALPKKTEFAKGITLRLTCADGCTVQMSLKIGRKKVKLPMIRVAAGASSEAIKVRFSAKLKKQIKAALRARKRVTLTVRSTSTAGSTAPATVRLK